MRDDKRIALYLLRNGSWKVRACMGAVAVGVLVVDPVVAFLGRVADSVKAGVAAVCGRLADAVSVEVKALGEAYKAQHGE